MKKDFLEKGFTQILKVNFKNELLDLQKLITKIIDFFSEI